MSKFNKNTKPNNNKSGESGNFRTDKGSKPGSDATKRGADGSGSSAGYKAGAKSNSRNDVGWYAGNDTIKNQIANIAYLNIGGRPINITSSNTNAGTVQAIAEYGSALAIGIVPTAGPSEWRDYVAQRIFQKVRGNVTGPTAFQAADYFMYIMAYASILSGIGYCAKVLSIVETFQTQNQVIPNKLLQVLKIGDSQRREIWSNLPNYYGRLNVMINSLMTMKIPAEIPLLTRALWITSGIYANDDGDANALYTMYPAYLYKYNPTKTSSGGGLDVIAFTAFDNGVQQTFSSLLNRLQDCIDVFVTDEDTLIMSAYTGKVFENCFTLEYYQQHAADMPRNEEVLLQIHNMKLIGNFEEMGKMNGVSQDASTGKIVCHDLDIKTTDLNVEDNYDYGRLSLLGIAQRYMCAAMDKQLLITSSKSPSADEIITSTRYVPTYKSSSVGDATYKYYYNGDYFAAWEAFYVDAELDDGVQRADGDNLMAGWTSKWPSFIDTESIGIPGNGTATSGVTSAVNLFDPAARTTVSDYTQYGLTMNEILRLFSVQGTLKYGPIITVGWSAIFADNGNGLELYGLFGKKDYITSISPAQVMQINYMAALSEFGCL